MAKIEVNCKHCGNSVLRFPSQVHGTIFCSRQCRSDYMRAHNTVTFKCDLCGKEKTIRKANYKEEGNHFCSRECKDSWQINGLAGERNPFHGKSHSRLTKQLISDTKKKAELIGEKAHNYSKQVVQCAQCGADIELTPYLIERSVNNFCSNTCHGAWKSNNLVGENSPTWNPLLTDEDREIKRKYPEYYAFMKEVLVRDGYACIICDFHSKWGAGLNVHHLNGYSWDIENRTNPSNAVTLCKDCHVDFHKNYGYRNVTVDQFSQYYTERLERSFLLS